MLTLEALDLANEEALESPAGLRGPARHRVILTGPRLPYLLESVRGTWYERLSTRYEEDT
jgi:hypothetical protein